MYKTIDKISNNKNNMAFKKEILINIGGLLGGVAIITTALRKIVRNWIDISKDIPFIGVSQDKFETKYEYEQNGVTRSFVKYADEIWREFNEKDEEINIFGESDRDRKFITIYDVSREMELKLPTIGGWALITCEQQELVDKPYVYVKRVA